MRSSKSRSRNKSRNRSVGNIVNRVFDSSGPEGKVRGTPQQIIDKYTQLARDAGLAGDRVATENFHQHAEHYLRMLGEAQREQDQRREQQEAENRNRQAERDRDRSSRNGNDGNNGGQNNGGHNNGGQNNGQHNGQNNGQNAGQSNGQSDRAEAPREQRQPEQEAAPAPVAEEAEAPKRSRAPRSRKADKPEEGEAAPAPKRKPRAKAEKPESAPADDVIDVSGDEDGGSMLVDTPEGQDRPKPAPRKRATSSRAKKPASKDGTAKSDTPPPEAAE